MSNVLLLTSQYTGVAGANGICSRNIVNELQKKGHQVSVICYDNGISENNVYKIPKKRASANINTIVKGFRFIQSYLFAVVDRETEQNFEKLALSLCDIKKIDVVICIFFPLETASVVKAVKDKYPNIKTIIYELDSIGDGIFSSSKLRYFAKLAFERWAGKNYRYCDRVIIMKSHEEYWMKIWGKKYKEKLLLADIPVLLDNLIPKENTDDTLPVSILYAGLLAQKYRSPEHLLSVFDIYSRRRQAFLNFYSKGDSEGVITAFAKKNAGIRQWGYVPTNILEEAIAKADVLVSVGNRVSRSVPSKLITYISYGKPVVHFSSQKGDVCVQYLEKYPLGLVLREWDNAETNANKLYEFVEKNRGKMVDFSEISNPFLMNTPSYSADLIEDIISSS